LETVAPVLAVRGYEDPTEAGQRLASTTRVVEVEQVAIGMVHDIQWPPPRILTSPDATFLEFPPGSARDLLAKKFGRPVDVVVFGDTHQPLVCWCDGVLLVNPGSPNYPNKRPKGSLGTLGILEVAVRLVSVQIVDLAALAPSVPGDAPKGIRVPLP